MRVLSPGFSAILALALAGTANAQFSTQGQTKGTAAQKNQFSAPAPTTRSTLPPGAMAMLMGGDDCALPEVVAGPGAFVYDLTAATTGTQGQSEAICLFFGSTAVTADVWFAWTANATGTAIATTCGDVIDTKIAAYAGSTCPTNGTALACNDDACGLQSTMSFPVTNGSTYMLQVGTFPGAATGIGVLNVSIATGPLAGDDCASPVAIAGDGPHPFDGTLATTGAQGQTEALCYFFGSTTIDNDLWFTWTATTTGTTTVSTCGMTTVDTKIAIYDGAGCPTGGALGCNDDACGFQTTAAFDAVAGNTYTIQVGTFPGSANGVGDFMFSTLPALNCYTLDSGTSNNAVGLTAGGDMIMMNGFTAGGGADVITQIEATFGTPAFPGGYTFAVPMVLAIWNDPTNDFDPNDAVLLYSAPVPAAGPANIDTDVFAVYPVPNVPVTGVFFIGLMFDNHLAGQFPGGLDQTLPGFGQAWVAGSTTGNGDLANLLNNDVPPLNMDAIGLPGRWMLRAVGPNCNAGAGVGTAYCAGDGTGTVPCPCGNTGSAGRGCANSTASGGGLLEGTGSASISAGNLVLKGSGLQPGQPGLYFQGNNAINGGNGIQNGDGLRCAGGNVRRLQVRTAGGVTSPNPGASETTVNIAVSGAVLPGDTKRYQLWYRNPAPGAPCGTGFNFSNGLEIVWVP